MLIFTHSPKTAVFWGYYPIFYPIFSPDTCMLLPYMTCFLPPLIIFTGSML